LNFLTNLFLSFSYDARKNFNGYLTYSQVPALDISTTVSYSNLISSYVDGAIYGIRLSKYLSFIDYSLSVSYTKVEYNYLSSISKLNQNNLSVDLSGRIMEQLYFSCSYEGVFEAQMNYLSQNGYTPISLDTMYGVYNNQASVSKPIVLTFDDGYIDFYTTAYPILRRFNFHAVSFIPTGLVGGGYYMNWDQIKEIAFSGLVTFEAHSVNHVNLPSYGYARVLQELKDSKNILQLQTGYPVNFIAYPGGASNGNVWWAAKQAGLVGGVGTWYGKAYGPGMNMPRIKVSGFWNINEFAARL